MLSRNFWTSGVLSHEGPHFDFLAVVAVSMVCCMRSNAFSSATRKHVNRNPFSIGHQQLRGIMFEPQKGEKNILCFGFLCACHWSLNSILPASEADRHDYRRHIFCKLCFASPRSVWMASSDHPQEVNSVETATDSVGRP